MRILLINVCLRYDSPIRIPPVGLACIATALDNAGFRPDILDIDLYRYTDEEIETFLRKNAYDIIGLGNIVSGYKFTKNICSLVKRIQPNTLLVVGNTVASTPKLLLKWNSAIDIAVAGEGDTTIVDIVKGRIGGENLQEIGGIAFRKNGNIVITPKREPIPRMEDIPFPNFSLFDISLYLKESYKTVPEPHPIPVEQMLTLPMNTARGCPFDCTFCYHAFKDAKYRFYPFSMVLDEYKKLQQKYGIKFLNFWDELTLVSKKRTLELCDAIEKTQVEAYWHIAPRANLFSSKDLDLLKRCKELGALAIGGALESSDPAILKAMNKKIVAKDFIEQMRTARKAGLAPNTSLVFGYPQETKETIRNTLEVCEQAEVYPTVGFVLPLPNTPIYQYAIDHGLIEDEEEYLLRIGDRQDLHVNLTKMSDKELFDTVREGMIKLKDKLGIPISDDKALKTGIYKTARKKIQVNT